jgi:hypothetical protein
MAAYRESFRDELGQMHELRWAAPGNFASGKESLATQASAALGRRSVTLACGAGIQQSVPYITENRGQTPVFPFCKSPSRSAAPLPSLTEIESRAPDRNATIVAAYATGGYSYQQLADYFGVHFTTVGNIVRQCR